MPLKTASRRFIVLANVLFLSLGVNLFLAGWLVGGSFDRPPPGPPNFFRDFETRLKGQLSERGQVLLQEGIDDLRAEFERFRPAADVSRKNLAKLIAAPAFDPDTLRATLQAAIDSRNQLDARSLNRITALLVQFDAKDRAAIADFIRRTPGPGPQHSQDTDPK
ncbi:periplasmic heavy metal sensor [Breoghania sp. L-A4]|uniref:periplasmic heavy metal sensor n=1 Tax=Breoghania sp. L-A4 TaxID=2304600 RepID=UPI000E360718|nr:periplasmic heavy metal sensor [Breoghania sp. L-A4]AXS41581.1 periplasmic heavy metal sensor [Breoghania sp. L-A4]